MKGWLVYIGSTLHYAFVLCPDIALQWCGGKGFALVCERSRVQYFFRGRVGVRMIMEK